MIHGLDSEYACNHEMTRGSVIFNAYQLSRYRNQNINVQMLVTQVTMKICKKTCIKSFTKYKKSN